MKRSSLISIALLSIAVLPLSGCFNGQKATTTMQAKMNSGNGVQAQQGPIRIENATVVRSEEGDAATLLVRIVNESIEPDALTFASINGEQVAILGATDAGVDLAPGSSTSFGWNSDLRIDVPALDAEIATYVPVELGFATAGLAPLSVLVVPQAGIYEDVTLLP